MRDARIQAAVVRDNEILILHVVIDDGRAFWLLPGGGREPHDANDAATIAREVFEETEATVVVERLLLDITAEPDDESYRRYITFLCRPTSDAVAGARDGIAIIDQLRWLPLDDETSWGDEIIQDLFLYSQIVNIRAALQRSDARRDV